MTYIFDIVNNITNQDDKPADMMQNEWNPKIIRNDSIP